MIPNNLSNLQALRMQVFGTPHGPFQNPSAPIAQPMPVRSPMLPAPNPSAGFGSGMPPVQMPISSQPVAAPGPRPVMGTAMPANGMNFNNLQALQSMAPQSMMRAPTSY